MDDFKLQGIEFSMGDSMEWDEDRSGRKIVKSAQFECLPCNVGLAMAMHNFWIYAYAVVTSKKIQ